MSDKYVQVPVSLIEPGPTVADLAARHCETFTGNATCAEDPDRSAESPYGATGYCYPCLIRNALAQQVRAVKPCCDRPGDPDWHTTSGSHVVPPDVEEDTGPRVAEPPRIEDMAPGTPQLRALTVDLEAVRDIINDIRNGEHLTWEDGWEDSNGQVLTSLLGEHVRLLSAAKSAPHTPFCLLHTTGECDCWKAWVRR